MIHIDYQGGAHGNFLEFVCNVMAGVKTLRNPFNQAGASHSKSYLSDKVFYAGHYSFLSIPMSYSKVVAVKIDVADLLPLSQISLLRAGDQGIDNDTLEVDTYNKLNNNDYKWVLDNILNSFFVGQIQSSYDAVKDPSWPSVKNLEDFYNLPAHIQRECIEVHDLKLLELNKDHPDCPRHILREFFQLGFEYPANHGFITQQQRMVYESNIAVYEFPFRTFYNHSEFLNQIESIASWAGISYNLQQQVADLHNMFLERQPYKDSKIKCDKIVLELMKSDTVLPKLNLLEEAYVNSQLKKHGHECRY